MKLGETVKQIIENHKANIKVMSVQDLPRETMKCILARAHGEDIDQLLYICNDYPKPTRKKGEVLIRVHACSLAPGDVRVLVRSLHYEFPISQLRTLL
jgi:hypothetical protein